MIKEILYRYNPWWEEIYTADKLIRRNIILEKMQTALDSGQIVFLTGLRRVGKTSLMKMMIAGLIQQGKAASDAIMYISLDNYQIEKESLTDIIDAFRQIHKHPLSKKIFVFLDEITYCEKIDVQLKNLYDSQNISLVVTASSALVLKEKKAMLTGRSRVIEVLPLDFSEYCEFRNITIKKRDTHLISEYFEDYMLDGGIPEFVLHHDIEYIKNLVDDILYKDIAAFHNIRNIQLLKDFFMLLMERSGKNVSINKIAAVLAISPDTAKRYLDMFVQTYLVHLLPRHGRTNERILAPKKLYSGDLGVRTYITGLRDKGSLFENYIYLKIMHKNPSYVLEEGIEIDFLTDDKTLIEVKYYSEMSEKQQVLFDSFNAKQKIIIKTVQDALDLQLLSSVN